MNAPTRLAGFAAGLAVLFGAGALAGGVADPDRGTQADADPATPEHPATEAGAHGAEEAAEHPVRGLAAAENGLRLVVDDPDLRRGRREIVRFRVLDASGGIVRDFDAVHTKRMHVIVARRDLTGFQHLHPEQRADGGWTLPLRLAEPGSYRLFADFSHGDEPVTLATDLRVDGEADLRALPEPTATAVSDGGYDVRLDADRVRPGEEARLSFAIGKDGHAVHTQPYLGAGGHLVALREGDLAFLHVHPTEDGHGDHGDGVGFAATFPTPGRYRLFLQFRHEGRVRTVAFTQEVS